LLWLRTLLFCYSWGITCLFGAYFHQSKCSIKVLLLQINDSHYTYRAQCSVI
jgi:hypothetical protein